MIDPEDYWNRKAAAPAVLEGAAAIERARQAWASPVVLVWRDERGEEICRSTPLEIGTRKVGIPLEAEHVDVIAVPADPSRCPFHPQAEVISQGKTMRKRYCGECGTFADGA